MSQRKSAAQHLVDALAAQGADRVFCVPGESYLAVLDALVDHRDQIEVITCRHEGGAAMMAEADGKLTGRPGVCMVTRGPGATNASAGIHVAFHDATPLVVFVGQVARDASERGAFQEIDYRRMFGQLTKWVAQIDRPERVHEYVARAFTVASAGRPGPVVLALPEDMLVEDVDLPAPPAASAPVEIHPSAQQMTALRDLLASAERPVVLVGGSRWTPEACFAIQRFALANELPVAASFRRQDRFDNASPNYTGDLGLGVNPKLKARIEDADVLLAIGARLGEVPTGYSLLQIPVPRQKLIHVLPGAEDLGAIYTPTLAINATPAGLATQLETLRPFARPGWVARRAAARAEYEAWQVPRAQPGKLDMGQAVLWMRENLKPDTIFTNGAGNFTVWLHRFHRHRRLGTQLAPTSGSMGYGVPAAVAAKLRHPDRTVVCLAGDGDFQMTMQELATAAQYGASVVFVVVDNGIYGTIRMHQERHYPGRVSATDMFSPDFAALARAYGGYSERVETTAEFGPAMQRAVGSGTLALLHLIVAAEALTPGQTLSEIRTAALAR